MTDHNHSHEIEDMVNNAVMAAVTRPEFLQSLIFGVLGQQASTLAQQAEAMSPIRATDAVTPFQPYNEAGDTLLLTNRRLSFNEHAATLIVTYTASKDDPTDVSFSTIVYKDGITHHHSTRFIEVDQPAREELERQLAAIFKPDMVGKSVQLTLLTIPAYFKKQQASSSN